MQSTGEVIGIASDARVALGKALLGAALLPPRPGVEGALALLSIADRDKETLPRLAAALTSAGYGLAATSGTREALARAGYEALPVTKLGEAAAAGGGADDGDKAAAEGGAADGDEAATKGAAHGGEAAAEGDAIATGGRGDRAEGKAGAVAAASAREVRILDLIASGDVRLVVNTPTPRSGAVRDAAEIRLAAIAEGILCLTAMETAVAAAEALDPEIAPRLSVVRSLDDWVPAAASGRQLAAPTGQPPAVPV